MGVLRALCLRHLCQTMTWHALAHLHRKARLIRTSSEAEPMMAQFILGTMFGICVCLFVAVLFTPLDKFGKRNAATSR